MQIRSAKVIQRVKASQFQSFRFWQKNMFVAYQLSRSTHVPKFSIHEVLQFRLSIDAFIIMKNMGTKVMSFAKPFNMSNHAIDQPRIILAIT